VTHSESIRQGGLMRCCIQTLNEERTPDKPPATEGDILQCTWCKALMRFTREAWEWAASPLQISVPASDSPTHTTDETADGSASRTRARRREKRP
jgi:hypothetical protein